MGGLCCRRARAGNDSAPAAPLHGNPTIVHCNPCSSRHVLPKVFWGRMDYATRAAMGTFVFLAVTVLTGQQLLPAVWLGNVLLHAALKDTVGDTLILIKAILYPLVPGMALSWVISLALPLFGVLSLCMFPLIMGVLTFFIMSCPWMDARNMIVLFAFVVIQSPLHMDIGVWYTPQLLGTCCVGLLTALIMAVLPLFRKPPTASENVSRLLKEIQRDVHMLLLQTGEYSANAGISATLAREALSEVELLTDRLDISTKDLEKYLPAAEAEFSISCKSFPDFTLAWVKHIRSQQAHIKHIRHTICQPLFGEESTLYNDALREAKSVLARRCKEPLQNLTSAIVEAMSFGFKGASWEGNDSVGTAQDVSMALQEALEAFKMELAPALREAEDALQKGPPTASRLAHLLRRKALFRAMFVLSSDLVIFLEADHKSASVSWTERLISTFRLAWLWQAVPTRRLALKSAVGMALSSLWIAVPQLYALAAPHAVWVGITVASVNLVTTGAAYTKCIDRLWGTLMAGAYGLMVAKIFPGTLDMARIPTVTLFTFVAIFLQDPKRTYPYMYATTTITSIMYGSITNNFDPSTSIVQYTSDRIELMFIGIIMFLAVEFLLFPRSSRMIVEVRSLQFFGSVNVFLGQLTKTMKLIAECTPTDGDGSASDGFYATTSSRAFAEILEVADEGTFDSFAEPITKETSHVGTSPTEAIDLLIKCREDVGRLVAEANRELEPGIAEPGFGVSIPLHPSGYRGLVKEQVECNALLGVLTDMVASFHHYYSQEIPASHPVRRLDSLGFYAHLADLATHQMAICCDALHLAFPDGACHPQPESVPVRAVQAGANFRTFQDVMLNYLAMWTDKDSEAINLTRSLGADEMYVPGFRTTQAYAVCVLLEVCHILHRSGIYLETIAHQFSPPLDLTERALNPQEP